MTDRLPRIPPSTEPLPGGGNNIGDSDLVPPPTGIPPFEPLPATPTAPPSPLPFDEPKHFD